MLKFSRVAAVSMLLALAACGSEGPTGPAGPAGPTGAQGLAGPAGPGTRIVVTGTIGSSGGLALALPAAAGNAFTNPPAMSCYLTSPGATSWLAIAGTPSTTAPYCGLVLSNGVFNAVMSQAPVGWTAAFVVVY